MFSHRSRRTGGGWGIVRFERGFGADRGKNKRVDAAGRGRGVEAVPARLHEQARRPAAAGAGGSPRRRGILPAVPGHPVLPGPDSGPGKPAFIHQSRPGIFQRRPLLVAFALQFGATLHNLL